MDTATVAVNGTRLSYEVAGSGSPIVLLHGGNIDRRLWDPQFLPLSVGTSTAAFSMSPDSRSCLIVCAAGVISAVPSRPASTIGP